MAIAITERSSQHHIRLQPPATPCAGTAPRQPSWILPRHRKQRWTSPQSHRPRLARRADTGIDALSDGDHRFASVIADFLIYEPLVKPGGFIVFDDDQDHLFSPEVKPAVDSLIGKLLGNPRYEVIGLIPDLQKCSEDGAQSNELVIHKRPLMS